MNLAIGFGTQVLHVLLMLATAPSLRGVIRWAQARLVGRAGPPLLQPWHDLVRLLRKEPVMPESASEAFAIGPLVASSAVAIVSILVPSFALGMTLAPFADLLAIAGLLALARCSIALAGMDAGAPFGGIGASRTMALGALSEPALLLVIFAFGLLAGSSNLDLVAAMQQEDGMGWRAGTALALVATLLLAIADSGGLAAGSEFAMQREALALEFSGRDLALVEASEALRLLVWLDLIAAMFVPFGIAPAGAELAALGFGLICWLVKLLVLAVALAFLQTIMGRVGFTHVPHMLGVAILLGLLAVVFLFAGAGTA